MQPDLDDPELITHLMRLCRSFHRLTGRHLVPPAEAAQMARAIEAAPFVVVSHGTEADPIFNFGNRTARELWELPWERFVQTPSRATVEPEGREAREALLARAARHGYIDDYAGVRISAGGQRFRIEQVVLWNVSDEAGRYCGQAATFPSWHFLSREMHRCTT